MSNAAKKKILILVEGEKTDVALMKQIFRMYPELDAKYEIIPYRTNIYVLYQEFFCNDEAQDSFDLLQVLKAREKDEVKKEIFDAKYTDILLIFDLDPQDSLFTDEKIIRMQQYFCESSDMGKLYINYPMVESFYHMTSIPDPQYFERTASLYELKNKTYKTRVNRESKGNSYSKFITSREECSTVIKHNIEKACNLLGMNLVLSPIWIEINFIGLLARQLKFLESGYIYVLCTCVIYVYDYNSNLLFKNEGME